MDDACGDEGDLDAQNHHPLCDGNPKTTMTRKIIGEMKIPTNAIKLNIIGLDGRM